MGTSKEVHTLLLFLSCRIFSFAFLIYHTYGLHKIRDDLSA
jgi:hypothetical protein